MQQRAIGFPCEAPAIGQVREFRVAEWGDDAAQVSAARAGDRAAFGRLYERYARMVHGILLARVPRDEVDDLVQDVFLRALGQLAWLRDAAAFGGWLAAIARNRAHDFHRRSPSATHTPDDPPARVVPLPDDLRDTRAQATEATVEAVAALNAIQSLPEAYRETLILRLVEGMSGPEIAARTGLTPASVRVNLHRGMKQLRARLDKEVRS